MSVSKVKDIMPPEPAGGAAAAGAGTGAGAVIVVVVVVVGIVTPPPIPSPLWEGREMDPGVTRGQHGSAGPSGVHKGSSSSCFMMHQFLLVLDSSLKSYTPNHKLCSGIRFAATSEPSRKGGGIYDVRAVLATGKRQRRGAKRLAAEKATS